MTLSVIAYFVLLRDVDPSEVVVGVETLRSFQVNIVGTGGTKSSKDERMSMTRERVQKRKMRALANLSKVLANLSTMLPSHHLCSTKKTVITISQVSEVL